MEEAELKTHEVIEKLGEIKSERQKIIEENNQKQKDLKNFDEIQKYYKIILKSNKEITSQQKKT